VAEDADPEVERGRTQSQELGVRKLELRGQRLEVRERGSAQKQHARRSQSGYRLGVALRGGTKARRVGKFPSLPSSHRLKEPNSRRHQVGGPGDCPPVSTPRASAASPIQAPLGPGVWGCPPPFPLGGGAGRGIEEPLRIHQSNCKEGTWSYSKRWIKTTRKEELR
jgi:hypothetical protein